MNKQALEQVNTTSVEKVMEEYGQEMITDYRYDSIDKHDSKMLSLNQEDYEAMKQIEAEIISRLEIAVKQSLNPNSLEAVEIAKLHKKWLSYTWTEYNSKMHLGLVDSYLTDKKFRAYYDKNVKGCAEYLRIAVRNYIYNEEDKENPKSMLNV